MCVSVCVCPCPLGSRTVHHSDVASQEPPGGAEPGRHPPRKGSRRGCAQSQLWPAAGACPRGPGAPAQRWSRRYGRGGGFPGLDLLYNCSRNVESFLICLLFKVFIELLLKSRPCCAFPTASWTLLHDGKFVPSLRTHWLMTFMFQSHFKYKKKTKSEIGSFKQPRLQASNLMFSSTFPLFIFSLSFNFFFPTPGGRNLPRSLLGSADSEGGVFAVPTTLPPNSTRHNRMFSPNKEAELAFRQQLDSISVRLAAHGTLSRPRAKSQRGQR